MSLGSKFLSNLTRAISKILPPQCFLGFPMGQTQSVCRLCFHFLIVLDQLGDFKVPLSPRNYRCYNVDGLNGFYHSFFIIGNLRNYERVADLFYEYPAICCEISFKQLQCTVYRCFYLKKFYLRILFIGLAYEQFLGIASKLKLISFHDSVL